MALGSLAMIVAAVVAVAVYYAVSGLLLGALGVSDELQEYRYNPIVMIMALSWAPFVGFILLVVLSYYHARYLFAGLGFDDDYNFLVQDVGSFYP